MAKKRNAKSKAKKSKASGVVKSSITNTINTEVIAAALSSVNQTIFLKLCRLCESKEGPFLNIFDSDKVTAKKIEDLMPFWIAENDDLPHKICFRCSAKVEELHEFVQRCIRTQENLRKLLGKSEPLSIKTKTRALWEEKLNQSNMSNDDICDALIKKAMEGIKDIPKLAPSAENRISTRASKSVNSKSESENSQKLGNKEDDDDITLKEIKGNKCGGSSKHSNNNRSSRNSNNETAEDECHSVQNNIQIPLTRSAIKQQSISINPASEATSCEKNKLDENSTIKPNNSNKKDTCESTNETNDTIKKPFNIMDHVSMIKVNGVGILFQCQLCNRNFLKKEVVMSHGCAKTGVPKIDLCNMYVPPEPPKLTTVKYINTRTSGDDRPGTVEQKTQENDSAKLNASSVKRKIGPASKIGRSIESSNISNENHQTSKDSLIPPNNFKKSCTEKGPVYRFPSLPDLNIRYKLIRGPNNSYTLVEDKTSSDERSDTDQEAAVNNTKKNDSVEIIDLAESPVDNRLKSASNSSKRTSAANRTAAARNDSNDPNSEPESSTAGQPYPVGLFQTVPHHSTNNESQQVPFTTPAMKKQSYTVVQTSNPNKLLISTKHQHPNEEVAKKRPKRARPAPKNDTNPQEPFSVILEDTAPPKDPGFFSFINVDPLLQPSYVLPTDNIIQESQISTSTILAKKEMGKSKDKEQDKYVCNICGEKFNREKKWNAHVYAHYNVVNDSRQEDKSRKHSRK
ncbi:unnamed protein product, partial [Iphiclides podalirius]